VTLFNKELKIPRAEPWVYVLEEVGDVLRRELHFL
jgi:hypothetical protein